MRKSIFAVVLVLAAGVAGPSTILSARQQELLGNGRPLIKDMPAQTSGWICPMHPNEVKAEPGKCSICGMTLVPGDPMATADYILHLTTDPKIVKAGEKTNFHIVIQHPLTGEAVTQFGEVHDKLFHLFIVSRDMKQFFHIHPTLEKDGSFDVAETLPVAGQYVLFSDFMPIGGSPQLISTPVTTAGFDGDIASSWPNLKTDSSFTKSIDGVKVEMQIEPSALVAEEEIDIPVHLSDEKTDQPIKDLQRYLGAFGHVMMLSEDMTEHVHAHPQETLEGTEIKDGGGPDLIFHGLFPKPGHYKMWLQFQRQGHLSTIPFTVRVLRSGETTTQQ